MNSNVIRLVTFDFVLGILRRGVMNVSLMWKILMMDLDNRSTNTSCF